MVKRARGATKSRGKSKSSKTRLSTKKKARKLVVRKKAPPKRTRAAKKAKKAAPKPRGQMLDAAMPVSAPASASLTRAALKPATARPAVDPKNGAINSCVNALMDAARPGWTDNGQMDSDYQYNDHSMRAFLSSIKACLQGKHYSLDINNNDFVTACVSAAIYQLKLLIYDRTT